MALTNAAGGIAAEYDYDAFGAPDDVGTVTNPYLFNGRHYDSESGLYYYRTRYMDPNVGRFTTRDTIGIWGDTSNLGNGYTYVANNPWTFVDPWGLEKYFGIHTNFDPNNINNNPLDVFGLAEGHAWISVYDTETKILTTYGIWPDNSFLENDTRKNGFFGNDLRINIEYDEYKHTEIPDGTISRYYRLTPLQEERLNNRLKDYVIWRTTFNCSSWVVDVSKDVVGENIDARINMPLLEFSILNLFEAPSFLYFEIKILELKEPSSRENPIEVPYIPFEPSILDIPDNALFH